MIAHVRGTLLAKHPNRAVVETGGVGYELTISVPTFTGLPAEGSVVALHVHTQVREDAIALFGFLRMEEKQLFERLIGVSGIGPRMAVTVLSGMQPEHLVAAIRNNDLATLTKVPGIGKKTAERMALELRDKLDGFGAAPAAKAHSPVEEDAISALVNLGYSQQAAEQAVSKAGRGGENFEQLFRAALGLLRR